MKLKWNAIWCVSAFALSPMGFAQQPQLPGPAPEHALLQKFVGEWDYESDCSMGDDAQSVRGQGSVTGRLLGSRWAVYELEVTTDGVKATGLHTIGYDPAEEAYVGSWVDSMTNQLWVLRGSYDAESKTLRLEADGPNHMEPGGATRYRDTYRFVDCQRIVCASAAKNEQGEWVTFMTAEMRRRTE